MSTFCNDPESTEINNIQNDIVQNNGICKQITTTSPEASSTASDSPTPTNSTLDKNWTTNKWQSLVCEEQRQLLGTEEESSDRQSDNENEGNDAGFGHFDVWEMTKEQKEYYKAQFVTLQPDGQGLLPGGIARAFFEKSKLSVAELRKIWQLADVTKDGALSLDEFNVAMHLVVLRRNHIAIPDTLPPSLVPNSPRTSAVSTSPHRGKQWTKFIESPTSSISSPGPEPVNFDFHKSALEQDPKILHPVALRVTPGAENEIQTTAVTNNSNTDISLIRPIQRPTPKKPAPGPGAILPPPPPQTICSTEDNVITVKKDPPPPPPRPHKHHTRSSSLDLTRLGRSGILNMPPVPPRTSPGSISPKKQVNKMDETGFANFAQFSNDKQTKSSQSAFQIYRKPGTSFQTSEEPRKWSPITDLPIEVSIEAREAYNAGLKQHCHELRSTLASLQEERALLEKIVNNTVPFLFSSFM